MYQYEGTHTLELEIIENQSMSSNGTWTKTLGITN